MRNSKSGSKAGSKTLTTEQMASVIPGLGDEHMGEDEKVCLLAYGVLDQLAVLGAVKYADDKPFLNNSGRVLFDRLMIKMQKVPPLEAILKALKSDRNPYKQSLPMSHEMMAKSASKILTTGILTSLEEYRAFRAKIQAKPPQTGQVDPGQPGDPEAA